MKSKTKKRVLVAATSVFAVSFFAGVMTILAANGKIDLSGVPVVGDAVASISEALGGSNLASPTATNLSVQATPSTAYTSPADIAVSDGYIYVADETGMKVQKVAVSSQRVEETYEAGEKVHGVYLNGDKVYALVGGLDGQVVVLNTSLDEQARIEVGHTPVAMTADGNTGYVANRFSDNVTVVDLSSNRATATIDVSGEEPTALQLAGDKLFVATRIANDSSREDVVSADLCVIDTNTNRESNAIPLINGGSSVRDLCLSPDGDTLYVSHIVARYTYPTSQLDRGWVNTNGISMIDVAGEKPTATVLLDEVEVGASNPWGIRLTDDGSKLVVALSGTHEAMVVDVNAMNAKISAVERGEGVVDTVDDIANYLPFLDGCRTRITLPGNGPRSVEIDGNTAYIGQYFTGDIAAVNLSDNSVETISFADQPEADAVRTGEMFWNDATYGYQQWESCASCHPDGRMDGFNWDELGDGVGTAKNTRSMVYAYRTPPALATGVEETAPANVRASIQDADLTEEFIACIDEYLSSLQPVDSPYLNRDGSLTASAENGKILFENNCASCHPAPLYTDMQLRDVGTTGTVDWENRPIDTPSLVETWRTGPWLHDGSLTTMEDVVRHFAPSLSDSEVTDLANFVLSIGDQGEDYGVVEITGTKADGSGLHSDLEPGATLESFSVRKQQEDAGDAKVIFDICDPSGNSLVNAVETDLENMDFNTSVTIDLDGLQVPGNLAAGSYIKVSIVDASTEEPVATDLIIKY